jgi:hypothetical protein
MTRLGWAEHDLACCLKNDPRKLAIAARLQMGTGRNAEVMLHRWMQHHVK